VLTATDPKRDPRNLPRYSPREAAHHLSVPAATVRAWSVGYDYSRADGETRRFQPLIKPATKSPLSLSFWNLVELYVLASLRRHHEVPMGKVREALRFTARELGASRPLIEETFYTDGFEIFVEKYETLIHATGDQMVLRDLLSRSLKRVDRGTDGRVLRFYPWLLSPEEPRAVEVDPTRSFGRLVLAGTGIPTEVVGDRFRGGDTIDVLAADYEVTRDRIEQALRWEQCAPRAA
jgi:uncharacterized protein (DUF433 family)